MFLQGDCEGRGTQQPTPSDAWSSVHGPRSTRYTQAEAEASSAGEPWSAGGCSQRRQSSHPGVSVPVPEQEVELLYKKFPTREKSVRKNC